jgi:hypothetical protein
VTNKVIDIFSQYKFLDPRIFGQSFYSFRNRFFFMTGYGNHTPVLKKSMEDEFTRRMYSIAFHELKKRIADMSTFLKKQSTALTEYDEQLVRRMIEKVTVFEDKFTVEFKSSVTVDVEG